MFLVTALWCLEQRPLLTRGTIFTLSDVKRRKIFVSVYKGSVLLWQKKQTFLVLPASRGEPVSGAACFVSTWVSSAFLDTSLEGALEITFLVIFFSAIIGNYILNLIRMEDRPSLLPGELFPKYFLRVSLLLLLIFLVFVLLFSSLPFPLPRLVVKVRHCFWESVKSYLQ